MNKMAFSQAYKRRSYDPPMPVLDIGVSKPGASVPAATVEAVVDTGADGTLLPLDVLEQAGAIFVDRAYLRGITGQRQAVDLYLATIHLGRFRITGYVPRHSRPERQPFLAATCSTNWTSHFEGRPM